MKQKVREAWKGDTMEASLSNWWLTGIKCGDCLIFLEPRVRRHIKDWFLGQSCQVGEGKELIWQPHYVLINHRGLFFSTSMCSCAVGLHGSAVSCISVSTEKLSNRSQMFEQWHEDNQRPWGQVITARAGVDNCPKALETKHLKSIWNVREPFLALLAVYVLSCCSNSPNIRL